MVRGKQFTDDEDAVIRVGLQQNQPITEIAKFLGRARQSVHKRIAKMRSSGELIDPRFDAVQSNEA